MPKSPSLPGAKLRVVLVVTHNGDRPIGTLLSEIHKGAIPGIDHYSYVTPNATRRVAMPLPTDTLPMWVCRSTARRT
jgi:hypothetical protein